MDSNFYQLLLLRGIDDITIPGILAKKKDKYTSPQISVPVRTEPVSNGSRFDVRFEYLSNLSNISLKIHCLVTSAANS